MATRRASLAAAPHGLPIVHCSECGHENPPGNFFCLDCGRALDRGQVAAATAARATLAAHARISQGQWQQARRRQRLVRSLTSVVLVLTTLAALCGPPLEAELWRPEALHARYFGGWLPGDLPKAVAGGSLSLPPPPPIRPWAPPGYGPVTVWPALAPSAAGYIWATPGWITQEYGCTTFALEPWSAGERCRFHHGIDIGNLPGTTIVAARAGVVSWAGWNDDGYGYRVVIDHGDGVVSRYAHFCCTPLVKVGQQVKQGDPIGKMGSTGASSGSHLHFAIEIEGRDIDPRTVLPPEAP